METASIFRVPTENGPKVALTTALCSLASPSFVVTGVVKYNTNETITVPFLAKREDKRKYLSALSVADK